VTSIGHRNFKGRIQVLERKREKRLITAIVRAGRSRLGGNKLRSAKVRVAENQSSTVASLVMGTIRGSKKEEKVKTEAANFFKMISPYEPQPRWEKA